MTDARREFHDKLSGLSRDIAIKQAELEQANVKDAITQGLVLEAPDSATRRKPMICASVNLFFTSNLLSSGLDSRVRCYSNPGGVSYAMAYETVIKAEIDGRMAAVEIYKSRVQAAQRSDTSHSFRVIRSSF